MNKYVKYLDNQNSRKSFKKKTKNADNSQKIELNDETIDRLVNSIDRLHDTPEDFLESFWQKYTNLNSTVGVTVIERMQNDIEKREKKLQELSKVQKAFERQQHPPLDKEEKEMCHRRLYTDAFLRVNKLNEKMKEREAEEIGQLKHYDRKASKKRIDAFLQRVNEEILENEKTLEQKRKIKQLKEDIEFQKIQNRSVSRGKLSKEREKKLVGKMGEYERKKWEKLEAKQKQKEKKVQKELSRYFKPKVSESSKKMAMNWRNKIPEIVTGGKIKSSNEKSKAPSEFINISVQDTIFERLYNESKMKIDPHWLKSYQNGDSLITDFKLSPRIPSRPTPSFQLQRKASPLTQVYPGSPKTTDEHTKLIMNKYLIDSSRVRSNVRIATDAEKYKSQGANSPWEFITWNESKYNCKSIDLYNSEVDRMRDEERKFRMMQPLGKKMGIKSWNSDTLNSGEDTQDLVNYQQSKLKKFDTRPKKIHNSMAYALLDRSLDNTINLIESARRKEFDDKTQCDKSKNDLGKSQERESDLGWKPQYQFQLKNNDRDVYLESYRKMQQLKMSTEDTW
jgi:hypothetical protein